MAPTPTIVATYSSASNTGNPTAVSVPNVQVGDWLVVGAFDMYADNPPAHAASGTGAGTWTAIVPQIGQTDTPGFFNEHLSTWRKVCTAAGTHTVSVNTQNESGFLVYHLRGCDAYAGTATSGVTTQTASNFAVIMSGITTTVTGALVIGFYGLASFTAAKTWTPPSGMTEQFDAHSPNGFDHYGSATEVRATTGATGTRTANSSGTGSTFGEAWVMLAIAGPTATAPTVNAGIDTTIDQYATLTRTATESDGGATITARTWTVVSGPNQVGATIGTAAALSWAPTVGGSYVIRYSATNSVGTSTDDAAIMVTGLNFPVTAPLRLTATRTTHGTRTAARGALIKLTGSRVGGRHTQGSRTAPIKLTATTIGQKYEVVSANIRLSASVETSSSQGAFPTATIKLHGAATGGRVTTGITRTAAIRIFAGRTNTMHRGETFRTALITLHMTRDGAKCAQVSPTALIRIAASIANRSRTSTAARIANIRLGGFTSGERHIAFGWETMANLPLIATTATSSTRVPRTVATTIRIFAQVSVQRIVSEILAIRPKADTTTKYIVVAVARVPQVAGPPVFLEVDPIEWTSLDWTEILNDDPTLSTSVKIGKLSEPILQRIRVPHELPTEIWCYRNGKRIFSGPLMGGGVNGDSINLEARGVSSYFKFMNVEADMNFTGVDQALIVKALVDQWQALAYGNFGIDTSGITVTGVVRTIQYLVNELHNVGARISDLSQMANAFDYSVNPASRRLELWSPGRGVDRSFGEDAIIFDARNVTNADVAFAVTPGDLASEVLGTASNSGADVPLIARFANEELRAKFGRVGTTANFDLADLPSLVAAVTAMGQGRGKVLLVPGPDARVTLDADLASYDVGDTVGYQPHGQVSVAGAYRIKKRGVKVQATGTELVSVEFT